LIAAGGSALLRLRKGRYAFRIHSEIHSTRCKVYKSYDLFSHFPLGIFHLTISILFSLNMADITITGAGDRKIQGMSSPHPYIHVLTI
jgi:hypothetical protein